MTPQSNKLGSLYENQDFCVFFGNRTFENSDTIFNENNLIFGNQTHESELIHVNINHDHGALTHLQSSDGMMTDQMHCKLAIYTADCVPCFIVSQDTLCSLHLGWRSIQKNLFDKALKISTKPLQIFIGPHIAFDSFEVGEEVISSLKESTGLKNDDSWFRHKKGSKFLVSLERILEIKSAPYGVQIYSNQIDTLRSQNHHSYRRNNANKARNISFAFLKNGV